MRWILTAFILLFVPVAALRHYEDEVAPKEREDVTFIVTTLADKPTARILAYKSKLDAAGDRIYHLHPLRFLEIIFTSEKLKVGIRNVKRKGGFVWSRFVGGICDSFREEASLSNLSQDQIDDFCEIVGIDPKLITPAIQQSQWHNVVDLLIQHVPREGGHGRYDV